MTSEEHGELVNLAWRYAAMVGILSHPEDAVDPDATKCDRQKYPHFIKTHEGMPYFVQEDGIEFMVMESSCPPKWCHAVICEQFPNESCSECGAPSSTTDCGLKAKDETHYIELRCVSCDHEESRVVECQDEFCEWCARLLAGL